MPVQINEIVIRANVVESAEKNTNAQPASPVTVDKDEIIKECAEIVLEILKAKTER